MAEVKEEMSKKKTLSEVCEELCPGVIERNKLFQRDYSTQCYHGLALPCDSPMCAELTKRFKEPR